MKLLLTFIAIIIATSVSASNKEPLVEIYRSKNTISLSKLFGGNVKQVKKGFNKEDFSLLPLKSNNWVEGTFERRRLSDDKIRAIFIVGCSEFSENWLIKRKQELMSQKAIGIIIDCGEKYELDNLKSVAYPLPVFLSSAEGLDRYLNHNIYPAYVHQKGIEQ